MGCGSIIEGSQKPIIQQFDKLVGDIQNHQVFSNQEQKSSVFESVVESSILPRSYEQHSGHLQQIDEQSIVFSPEKPNRSVTEIHLDNIDRRKFNKDHNYPYDCIVRLSFYIIESSGSHEVTATGVVVSQQIILTSAHFLQAYRDCKDKCTKINAYLPGKANNAYEAHFQCFMPEYCNLLQLIQYDFGFIRLKRKIEQQKFLSIALNFQFTNYPAQLCGFTVQNKQKKMKGLIEKFEDEYIEYDIDSSFGQSGSPVLIKIQSGQYYMVSSHSGFYISFIEDGKKVKFKKKQDQLNQLAGSYHALLKKFQKGEYQKDSLNSGCRLTKMHKNFLIDSLRTHLNDQPKEDVDLIIAAIKFIDLSEIPAIKFPKQYYAKQNASAKPKKAQIQRKDVNSMKIQKSKVTELQSNVVSAIPANDDLHSTLKAAKMFYKQKRNHQSLIQCHRAYGKIKENKLLMMQFLDLIGSNLQQLHSPHIAKIYYKKCVELAQTVTQNDIMNNPDFLSIIKIFHNLGVMELEEENIEKAKYFFEKCQQCLFKKNKDKIQHYAATEINLSLILIRQKIEDPNKIIDRLKASLGILQSVSNEHNNQTIGKIQAIRNILKILFQQGKHEEWLKLILEQMETIVQMKLEEGIYNIFDAKPSDTSHLKELHRVVYKEPNENIDKRHQLPTYFVSWKEELLEQVDKILENNDIKGLFQLKLCFAFRELFKGLAGKTIAALQKKMRALKIEEQKINK